jgi:hypothetical protein
MEMTGLEGAPDEAPVLAGGGTITEPDDAGPVVAGAEVVRTVETGGEREVIGPVGTPVLLGGQTVVE